MKKLIPYNPPSATTRFFLVVLRLAIGWHLFVEGVTKLETFYTGPTGMSKPFSSRGYLQQSQGPLAPLFRGMAGDPDEQLLLRLKHDPGRLPVVLEKQWRDYLDRYVRHYGMSGEQKQKAEAVLEEHLQQLKAWFESGAREVTRDYSFATTTPLMTTQARIAEYQEKLKAWRERVDGWNLQFGKDVTKSTVSTLRSEVGKLRAELQKDLEDRQTAFSRELDKFLTEEQQKKDFEVYLPRLVQAARSQGYGADQQALADLVAAARASSALSAQAWETLSNSPEKLLQEMQQNPQLRKTLYTVSKKNVAPPLQIEDSWLLDVADRLVAWGLTLCGLGLLLGCFTRLSALGGALLLLLFYLSLPPLPNLPENPLAEGKYLFVNKNLIEALALLVIASTPSGRWFGLDALLSWIPPFSYFWPKTKYVEIECSRVR